MRSGSIISWLRSALLLTGAGCTLSLSFADRGRAVSAPAADQVATIAPPVLPDVTLIDQRDQRFSLKSELASADYVVINFVYTTCTMICSPMSAIIRKVQQKTLGRLRVKFLSVSLDPENDTPQRLREFSEKFRPAPGWSFLTGDSRSLEPVWKTFQATGGAAKQAHAPLIYLGNLKAERWTRIQSVPSADQLVTVLEHL